MKTTMSSSQASVNTNSDKETIVAMLGISGSYHDIATRKYFGEGINVIACQNFPHIFQTLDAKHAGYAVMAIENTVAGTILPNYALLRESNYRIIGEVYLRIQHQLLCINGQKIEDIREVRSHPMAILQCKKFFSQYPNIRLVNHQNTASCAKELKESQEKGMAVIASSLSGELYGLNTLAADIEDNKRNFTRFLVLEQRNGYNIENLTANKVSLSFHLGHNVGTLAGVLALLAGSSINLTKIQSLPLLGREWEYYFHLDMEFSDYEIFQSAISRIEPLLEELQILGEYRKGEMPR